MKKFGDFAKEEHRLEGKKISIDALINKDIDILGFNLSNSKYNKNESGKYATVQFKYEGETNKYVFFSGSDVIIKQLMKYKEEIPFETKIIKINRYYTFS